MSDLFAARDSADLVKLVSDHPLAWVVAHGAAALVPLRPLLDDDGGLGALEGHLGRNSDLARSLAERPEALILFVGAQCYVSPSWFRDRTQAPTWNYASAQFGVRVRFMDSEAALVQHLRRLVGDMERRVGGDWRLEDMGDRYSSLARRIVAFRADVMSATPRFKLGQDERDDVFADMMAKLVVRDPGLATQMGSFNAGRYRG